MRFLCLGVVVFWCASSATASDDVRDAVSRSLPFLEKQGVAWIADRGCVSCHQTSFLIWTHKEARQRGINVDDNKLNAWTSWALLNVLAAEQNGTRQGAETLSQLLLSRDPKSALVAKPTKGARAAEPYENIVKDLLAGQMGEGNWPTGGQSSNPPETATGWALFALATRDPSVKAEGGATPDLEKLINANDEASKKAAERAKAWLKTLKEDPAKDLTEQLVVRLLVEATSGDPGRVKQRAADLTARQNSDGGWSVDPKLGQPSDAFATGMVLYALSRSGDKLDMANAREFLLRTQQPDGSWHVPTTAFHPLTGKPRDARTNEVYTYWGTAWAALGLLSTFPDAGR